MIKRVTASGRYHAKQGWLDTYHLFSFANYYDPDNLQFGTLRVFNDDRIDAYSGFGDHAHENMEIVTIMLEGQLTHRDSLGNKKTINAGEVQRMSAGTGVIHAEKNLADEPVHLYQIWLTPLHEGIQPGYEQKDFSFLVEKNILFPVVKHGGGEQSLNIQADAAIFLLELEPHKTVDYTLETQRGLFMYVESGSFRINDQEFRVGDQARIEQESLLHLTTSNGGKAVLIDVSLV